MSLFDFTNQNGDGSMGVGDAGGHPVAVVNLTDVATTRGIPLTGVTLSGDGSATADVITCESTAGLTAGMIVLIADYGYGPLAITRVIDATHFAISSSLVLGPLSGGTALAGGNTLTCDSTAGLQPGYAVVFSDMTCAGPNNSAMITAVAADGFTFTIDEPASDTTGGGTAIAGDVGGATNTPGDSLNNWTQDGTWPAEKYPEDPDVATNYTSQSINSGLFQGDTFDVQGTIYGGMYGLPGGGEYYALSTVYINCSVYGGTFYVVVVCYSQLYAGSYYLPVACYFGAPIYGGCFYAPVTMDVFSQVLGGVFNGPLVSYYPANEGPHRGATFCGQVLDLSGGAAFQGCAFGASSFVSWPAGTTAPTFDDACTFAATAPAIITQPPLPSGGGLTTAEHDALVAAAATIAALPTFPGDPASNTQVNTRLAASDYVAPDNAGIATIQANTENHPDPSAPVLASADYDAIADAVLARSVANVESAADPHSLCYVVLAMSESNTTTHANALTVFRSDGITEFVQKAITSSTAADPITGVS